MEQVIKQVRLLLDSDNSGHGFDHIEKSKTHLSWICFKNDMVSKNASFSADLVEETSVQGQTPQYKKVASLGGGCIEITPSKNRNLLLACMRINLERKLER